MKGAIADPWVRTKSAPSKSNMSIMGASQNFLRIFKKSHKSFNNSIILIFL